MLVAINVTACVELELKLNEFIRMLTLHRNRTTCKRWDASENESDGVVLTLGEVYRL